MEIKRAKYNLTRPVRYGGHEYIMQELILWVAQDASGAKQLRYSAMLQDRNGHAIVRAPLDTVEEMDQ